MGLFDSLDYEKTLQELGEILGADDRVTGMIPDTNGNPLGVDSYGKRYLDRMGDLIRRGGYGLRDLHPGGQEMGSGLISYDTTRDGYTSDTERVAKPFVYSPYVTEDGGYRFGLDDPTAANRISINRLASDGAKWVRDDNDELVDNFRRGVSLAEDNESFIDRQTYLEDGSVGSEEEARGYKLEGGRELLRGIGYGGVDVADSLLGMAVDRDHPLRYPTGRMLDALSYENTGDDGVDMPLSTMHSLGSSIGEMVATGGATGAVRKGLVSAGAKLPAIAGRGLVHPMASGVQQMGQSSGIEQFLHTRLGSAIFDFVADGLVDTAMIRQVAERENWSEEELQTALITARALAMAGLSWDYRPTMQGVIRWRDSAFGEPEGWQPETFKKPGKPLGRRYDEIAADAGPKLKMKESSKTGYKKSVLEVEQDPKGRGPLYEDREQYDFSDATKKSHDGKNYSIMPQVQKYPPEPNIMLGRNDKKGRIEHSKEWENARDLDKKMPVPNLDNEELIVDGKRSRVYDGIYDELAERRKNVKKQNEDIDKENAEREKAGNPERLEKIKMPQIAELRAERDAQLALDLREPFIPQVPLVPSYELIMEKELERVFGKHSILEEVSPDKYHVTLPNGVELNVRTYHRIPLDDETKSQVKNRYRLPNRTLFSLKGNTIKADSYALIQLSDLREHDTLQHQAVHLAMNTVTTRKEKETLRELFGPREEDQVAGVMEAIREERVRQAEHPDSFLRRLLRRIEEFGCYVRDFVKNVPTALAKRDWSYLTGKTPDETLKDYAKSFVDGSIWGHEIAPNMREFIDSHRESIAEAVKKEHSRRFVDRVGLRIYDHSPNILQLLRGNDRPLTMDRGIFSKVLLEKHGDEITSRQIEQLPHAMEDPVLIIRSDWTERGSSKREIKKNAQIDKNGYNFILDIEDEYGGNICMPILFTDGETKIKSIYSMLTEKSKLMGEPKFDRKAFLGMINSDKLAYVNPGKVLRMVQRYTPKDYLAVRDRLYRNLPDTVYTPEKYRVWRRSRGLKPFTEQEEYFERRFNHSSQWDRYDNRHKNDYKDNEQEGNQKKNGDNRNKNGGNRKQNGGNKHQGKPKGGNKKNSGNNKQQGKQKGGNGDNRQPQ